MKNSLLIINLLLSSYCFGQQVPAPEENIPFLVTFGNAAKTSFGDDDFCQVFFFTIPEDNKKPIYIRIFDPENGGENDERMGRFDSKTKFSVYGGKGCITNKDSRSTQPVGQFKSGNLLSTKTFGVDPKYDNNWYTFGPFNPLEGELSSIYGGYVFKIIAEGISGDDGNLYKYFLSSSSSSNIAIEGANSFTFEYSFRLHNDPKQVSHIYPFVDDKVTSVKITNFDWDNDGFILISSVATINYKAKVSGDDAWATSEYIIKEAEKGKSLDIQIKKNPLKPINNNNVVIYITNQYGESLPFYAIPIGGVPQFKADIKATPIED